MSISYALTLHLFTICLSYSFVRFEHFVSVSSVLITLMKKELIHFNQIELQVFILFAFKTTGKQEEWHIDVVTVLMILTTPNYSLDCNKVTVIV